MHLHFLLNMMKGLQKIIKKKYTPIKFQLAEFWGSARCDSTKRHHTQVGWHLHNSHKAAEISCFLLLKTSPRALHCAAAAWPYCWVSVCWTRGQPDQTFSPRKEKFRQLSSTSARQIPVHGLDQLPGTYPKHHTADYILQRDAEIFSFSLSKCGSYQNQYIPNSYFCFLTDKTRQFHWRSCLAHDLYLTYCKCSSLKYNPVIYDSHYTPWVHTQNPPELVMKKA